jgi:hypothetical protein
MAGNDNVVGRYRRFDNLKLGRLLADIAEDATSLDSADRGALKEAARRLALAARASQASRTPLGTRPHIGRELGP